MNKEVSNSHILQAITELSEQLNQTENRLNQRIDTLDAKVSVLSEGLLNTQADVKILKSAK